MNYDCERPTSRVMQPPGGGTSNIFGGADTTVASTKAKSNNPSFQSSVFSKHEETGNQKLTSVHEGCKPEISTFREDAFGEGREESKDFVEGMASRKSTDTFIYNTNERPTTTPFQNVKVTGTIQSTVFKYLDYPENANYQPGVSQRPNTAFKPATNNTKSSLFCDKEKPINEVKGSYRKPLSRKSTVFDVAPQQVVLRKEVSKTYQTTMNESEFPSNALYQKRALKDFNDSSMIGSSCDVETDHLKPVVMSSDFNVTPLRDTVYASRRNGHSQPLPENGAGIFHGPDDDAPIAKQRQSGMNAKSDPNKTTNNSLKSDEFKVSCGMMEAPQSHSSFHLWSCDGHSSCKNTENVKMRQHMKSNVFSASTDSAQAPLWTSGFCQSVLPSDRRCSNARKNQSSNIFF